MRKLLPIVLAAAACCAFLFATACGGSSAASDDGAVQADEAAAPAVDAQELSGQPASEAFGNLNAFEAVALDGSTLDQGIFAQADVTIVNFWATFCGPCLEEMPALAEFAGELPPNMQLVTVCLDADSVDASAIEEILDEAGFGGVTIVGGDGDLAAIASNIVYIPTTIAFDSEGNAIGYSIIGSPPDLGAAYGQFVDDTLIALDEGAGD